MNEQPLVSVIMPVYNAAVYLPDTIESILNQTYINFELLLLDDGSSDGSADICDKYALKDNRIKVIHKNNEGICKTRNLGLEISQGEYIAFCDHDDLYHENYLSDCIDCMIKYSPDVVKFTYETISVNLLDSSEYSQYYCCPLVKGYFNYDLFDNYYQFNSMKRVIWNGIYSRKYLLNHKIKFNYRFKTGYEDIDFMEEIYKNKGSIYCLPQCLYTHYHRLGQSTSAKFDENRINDVEYVRKKEVELFINNNITYNTWINHRLYWLDQYMLFVLNDNCLYSFSDKLTILRSYRKLSKPNRKFKFLFLINYFIENPKWKFVKYILFCFNLPLLMYIMKKNGKNDF